MKGLRFDWHFIAQDIDLIEISNQLSDRVLAGLPESSRGVNISRRNAEIKLIAQHIISALYQAMANPFLDTQQVALPLRESAYSRTNPEKVNYSYGYTVAAKDELVNLDWIKLDIGSEEAGYTRIKPSKKLIQRFDKLGFRWLRIKPTPPEKLVELRDVQRDKAGNVIRINGKTSKVTLETPLTPEVKQYQENLLKINKFLLQHCIHLELDDDNLEKLREELSSRETDDESIQINLYNTQLTRIFSRGSLEKGGRFYRGWWQQIPSRHRPHIRIDGYMTVEVDYSSMAFRILYAQIGYPYPTDSDIYDIGLDGWVGKDDERRPIVKEFMNALINDEDGVYRLKSEHKNALKLNHEQLMAKLKDKHPKIFSEIDNGIGLKLQFIDSQIAERVMLEMMNDGIVVLPIHDSFIVRAGYQQWLTSVMRNVFRDLTGSDTSVEAEIIKNNEHYGLTTEETEELANDYASNVYSLEEVVEQIANRQFSIMDYYLKSWELSKNCSLNH